MLLLREKKKLPPHFFPERSAGIRGSSTMIRTAPAPIRCISVAFLLCHAAGSWAFIVRNGLPRETTSCLYLAKDNEDQQTTTNYPLLTKASWYAVEAFGKMFGSKNGSSKKDDDDNDMDLTKSPTSMQETLARIQLDNDRSYFLSGKVDTLIYDPDCIFCDPFVSFKGRDRFVNNLANLGSFITNYSAKMIDYTTEETTSSVTTKVMVKLELKLPWKPVLAWPWGVDYSIDPDTFLITKHEESWDIEPWEGVKQIFRKPTTQIKE